MAVNTKDKSVINYLQTIGYPLQLFAHQIAMPSTAAQMCQPSLAGPLTTHPQLSPKLPQGTAGQAEPLTGRMNRGFPLSENFSVSIP